MSKHTQTPWVLAATSSSCSIVDNAQTGLWKPICDTHKPEDAAHIVKCVNLHDELVRLVEMYKQDIKVNNYSWVKMQQIDEALKRAKGEV